MRLIQFLDADGQRRVAVSSSVNSPDAGLQVLPGMLRVYDLACEAISVQTSLQALVEANLVEAEVMTEMLSELESAGRLLPPLDHPDPAHCFVTGTGLTHVGSADTRDSMHQQTDEAELTDSMKMFRWGLAGGKPELGTIGMQPEWFYKGNGYGVVTSGQALTSPGFAKDGGEEPELAGLYIVSPEGTPYRVGFALGNEFSDHVTEQENYLYLAHSKLRACGLGPELRLGDLPERVEGVSKILRDGTTLWEKPFSSGEEVMSHSIANLEHHHFKYDLFRQPGDVHIHFFGTSTLSSADGIITQAGDVFEISAPLFGHPLRNRLEQADDDELVEVKLL
ncbi:MAG: AraD1 family protein [Deinococcota bacterium]